MKPKPPSLEAPSALQSGFLASEHHSPVHEAMGHVRRPVLEGGRAGT